jgi:hypothetical protein
LAQTAPENVALHQPYTLSPPPNYGLCTDPGDATQLTDGMYSQGHFWTQPETVGWGGGGLRFITLDLGQVVPIAGLSFNTAAGVADVRWVKSILIFVSDDGKAWHKVGNLIELLEPGFLPEYGAYAVKKLTTNALATHGRYVQLALQPDQSYLFVDEIEVYRGPEALLNAALPGEAIADVPVQMKQEAFSGLVRAQLRRDLAAARADLSTPGLAENRRQALTGKADQLGTQVREMAPVAPQGFRAILPMTDLERAIFAFQAEVWRAQGKPLLRVWHAHRWEYLAPSDEPPVNAEPPALVVRMMNGERRADVLNFTNAAEPDAKLRLRIEGLPGGPNPAYVTIHEVLHTGTRRAASVAAALPLAKREGNGFVVTVPSGMAVQAWFEFQPQDLPAGRHEGKLIVDRDGAPSATVPVRLTVSPVKFPDQATLLVGGWDYTDGAGSYGITAKNREAVIRYLQDHRVNVTWAGGSAMPAGQFDDQGNLTEKPDTARFDEWVGQWPQARLYLVFLGGADSFAGAKIGTEEFRVRVGNWAHFWAQHMRDLGLKPSRLGYLQYDEPNETQGYTINEEWAKAFRAAEPEIVRFVDPQPQEPETCVPMMEQMTVLCPHRPQWLTTDSFPALFEDQRAKGRDLWFYSAAGPARTFDPFSYYLAEPWHAFAVGGKGASFWAFGDNSNTPTWNEYASDGSPYCPLFLTEDSVVSAKWMEAVTEGSEDFECLVMLRERVAQLEAAGKAGEQVAQAQALLQTGPQRVLAMEKGMNYTWDQPKDRAIADQVRYEVLDMLEKF